MRTLTIEFVGADEAAAESKAESLAALLGDRAPDIDVSRVAHGQAQSAGIILAVTLGPPAVLTVAAAIEDFIHRDDTKVRINTDGEAIFEGAAGSATDLRAALGAAVSDR